MKAPFRQNEHVKYGVNGVCLISDIQTIKAPDSGEENEYYVLKPISAPASTIYVPKSNELLMSKMRKLLSREEIERMVASAEKDELHWVEDRKERGVQFHAILSRCDQQELLCLTKCIYLQRIKLSAEGRKLSTSDEAAIKQAEELIENELSFVLNMPNKQVGAYIRNLLKISEAEEAQSI